VRSLVDVQLPRPLVGVFLRNGHTADYATDHLPAVDDDSAIWRLAAELHAAIVSKDEDFFDLITRRLEPIVVVWLRCGNIYNPDLYALIERSLPAILAAIERGERLIEIR